MHVGRLKVNTLLRIEQIWKTVYANPKVFSQLYIDFFKLASFKFKIEGASHICFYLDNVNSNVHLKRGGPSAWRLGRES
jgi:hypothetical protein